MVPMLSILFPVKIELLTTIGEPIARIAAPPELPPSVSEKLLEPVFPWNTELEMVVLVPLSAKALALFPARVLLRNNEFETVVVPPEIDTAPLPSLSMNELPVIDVDPPV